MSLNGDTHSQEKNINELITERLAIRVQIYHSLYLQYYTSSTPSSQQKISTKGEIESSQIQPKKGQFLNSWP